MTKQEVCRQEFSDGKQAASTFQPTLTFSFTVFGVRYHLLLLDGLTPCRACRFFLMEFLPSNGSLDIIQKASRVDIPYKDNDSED